MTWYLRDNGRIVDPEGGIRSLTETPFECVSGGSTLSIDGMHDCAAVIFGENVPVSRWLPRITGMLALQLPPLVSQYVAWPLDLIEEEGRDTRAVMIPSRRDGQATGRQPVRGALRGFVCSSISEAVSLQRLILNGVGTRASRISANLASCMQMLHAYGVICGDLSTFRIFVHPDTCRVFISDACRFQFASPHDHMLYPCEVGSNAFIAPEVRARASVRRPLSSVDLRLYAATGFLSFRRSRAFSGTLIVPRGVRGNPTDVYFTIESDRFALAVVIYVVYNGGFYLLAPFRADVHGFSHISRSAPPSPFPFSRSYRFGWVHMDLSTRIDVLRMEWKAMRTLDRKVRECMSACIGEHAVKRGFPPDDRPTAAEWHDALANATGTASFAPAPFEATTTFVSDTDARDEIMRVHRHDIAGSESAASAHVFRRTALLAAFGFGLSGMLVLAARIGMLGGVAGGHVDAFAVIGMLMPLVFSLAAFLCVAAICNRKRCVKGFPLSHYIAAFSSSALAAVLACALALGKH